MNKKGKVLTQKDKLLRLAISIMIGILIALLPPPVGVERVGMIYMGIFISTILMLCLKAADDITAALYLIVSCCLFGVCTFGEAMKALSTSSIGIVYGVLFLAVGIGNSGLMKRLALKIMTLVPNSYNGRIAGLIGAGLVMSPLISSTVAKGQIMAPMATMITELSGIEKKSKPALGLLFASFISSYIFGYCFMSGTSNSPMLAGYASDAASDVIRSWTGWLSMTWPWLLALIVGTWLFCTVICKPKPGEVKDLPPSYFKEQYEALGPWSAKEKWTALVLVYTFVMWMLSPVTGIDSAVVALSGCLLLCFAGLLGSRDFSNRITWGLIFFMAAMFAIPSYLTSLGWAEVIKNVIGPVVAPLVSNVWIFVPCIMILNVLLRFLVASQVACLAIFIAVFAPLLEAQGIALIVLIWPLYMIGNYWVFPYQNPFVMGCFAASGGEYVSEAQFCKSSWYYLGITFIGMMLTIPVFKMLGLC